MRPMGWYEQAATACGLGWIAPLDRIGRCSRKLLEADHQVSHLRHLASE
jgi:hypothetical protein